MIIQQLKDNYPKTWTNFIEYLRANYEFWEHEKTSEQTLWFCERKFETQLGYFLGWLETSEIMENSSTLWDPENTLNDVEKPTEFFKKAIPLIFKYLEDRVFI